MKRYLIIMILIPLLFLTACETTIMEPRESSIWERRQVNFSRIINNNTPVREGIGENFRIVRGLDEGQEVDVISEIGNWYILRLDDDSLGSVNQENATPVVKEEDETEEEEVEDAPEGTMEEAEEEIEPVDNVNEDEERMVNMINQARAENNIQSLEINIELIRIARIKSEDMVENDYFSHNSPTYGSPFDMLDHFEVEYLYAGENIAANASIENAHNSLMDSQGHRRNILNENYTHVGVGIVSSPQYGNMITQIFTGKPE